MSLIGEPTAWLWKHLPSGNVGVYLEDPTKFGIDLKHKDYEWTLVVPMAAPSTPAEPLSEFREGQWWIKELDEMANNPIGEEIFVTADLKRAVATVHHLLRAVRESEVQKNAN